MHAIITVVGKDQVGIIAGICTRLASFKVNILDISQTIMEGSFTMVMAVDLSGMTASFGALKDALSEVGKELGLSVRIQREEIFNSMNII